MSRILNSFIGFCLVTVFVLIAMYYWISRTGLLDVRYVGKLSSSVSKRWSHLQASRRPISSNLYDDIFLPRESKGSLESFLSQQLSESSKSPSNKSYHLLDIALKPVKRNDSLCTQCLDERDEKFFSQCGKRLALKRKDGTRCRFINGSRRAAVALASFPGSGNTWVRGLLEKATGVCTGSIYCDGGIASAGMYGENVRSGAVLVVKTHRRLGHVWTKPDQPQYESAKQPSYGGAILIIRNPYDAFIAEWSRRNAGHTGTTQEKKFGERETWNKFIDVKSKFWSSYFIDWVVDAQPATHVVRYEDLKLDAVGEVTKMLDYLHFKYNKEEVETRLTSDYGKFHRKHKDDDFEHYTTDQRLLINQTIASTLEYLTTNWTSTLGLQEYLWYN